MSAIYIDCTGPMLAHYDDEMQALWPELAVHRAEPAADALAGLIGENRGVLNGHTYLGAEVLGACPDLEVMVFLGIGATSYIDMDTAERRGVKVLNVTRYGDRTVAEHTLALMLAGVRSIAAMDRLMRDGGWEPRQGGVELRGKTLGILGLGGIGQEMARLGAALGMEVVAWSRSGLPDGVPARFAEIDAVVAGADVLSLHLAATPETEQILDRRRLALLRPEAVLVNTARGALIDEDALIEALEAGHIGHAALDVYAEEPLPADHPLRGIENVTLTPHAAWISPEAARRLLIRGIETLRDALVPKV
ncbi:MAG: NAD(P)-dependent oxidoreductase [Alphaproteobacteria bacterium]|jgi:D-3-phosphoglycerate dehydrogenase|nr:NAD(P)-dependent oxidoreductase [Alphaproteobacteria bacterium]